MYQVGDYITVSDNSGLERIRGKTGRITKVLDSGIVAVKLDNGGSATLKFSDIIPAGNMVTFDNPEDSPVPIPTITGYVPPPDAQMVDFVHWTEGPSPAVDMIGPGGMQTPEQVQWGESPDSTALINVGPGGTPPEASMIDFIDPVTETGPVAEPDKKGLPWWAIGAGIIAALLFLKK
jgi:hypothetical protein